MTSSTALSTSWPAPTTRSTRTAGVGGSGYSASRPDAVPKWCQTGHRCSFCNPLQDVSFMRWNRGMLDPADIWAQNVWRIIYVDQLQYGVLKSAPAVTCCFWFELKPCSECMWMHCSINPSWNLEEPISACPAMRVLHVALPFLCLSSGAATCLDDAIPPSERKNLTNAEGLAWLCWGPTQSHDTTSWDSPRETLKITKAPLMPELFDPV